MNEEKRTPEELKTSLENPKDLAFMHKIVSNSAIMKFPLTLRKGFSVETDDLKFGFYLHVETKRSSTSTLNVKVPIMINTGRLKINNSGGNVSSAQSVASSRQGGRGAKPEVIQKAQEERLKAGKAQMLDTSFVSSATEKERLDQSF